MIDISKDFEEFCKSYDVNIEAEKEHHSAVWSWVTREYLAKTMFNIADVLNKEYDASISISSEFANYGTNITF